MIKPKAKNERQCIPLVVGLEIALHLRLNAQPSWLFLLLSNEEPAKQTKLEQKPRNFFTLLHVFLSKYTSLSYIHACDELKGNSFSFLLWKK